MSFLRFEQDGVTPMQFQRNDLWPRQQEVDEGQITAESEGGRPRIATLHAPIHYLHLNFAGQGGMLHDDYVALQAFLLDPLVNLRAHQFTFIDTDLVEYQVRYWNGLYQFARITPTLWQGTLTLREET